MKIKLTKLDEHSRNKEPRKPYPWLFSFFILQSYKSNFWIKPHLFIPRISFVALRRVKCNAHDMSDHLKKKWFKIDQSESWKQTSLRFFGIHKLFASFSISKREDFRQHLESFWFKILISRRNQTKRRGKIFIRGHMISKQHLRTQRDWQRLGAKMHAVNSLVNEIPQVIQ